MATIASDVLLTGTHAARPAAGIAGRLYAETDTTIIYQDNGSAWVQYGPGAALSNPMSNAGDLIRGGTAGAPTQLVIGSSGQVLTVSGGLPTWAAPTSAFTGSEVSGTDFAPSGLTGVTAASRYVGALNTGGTPASGTFAVGDFLVGRDGTIWVCTTAGSPGTWTQVGAGGTAYITQLATSAPGSNVASITFSSISGSYRALWLVWYGRTSSGNTYDVLQVTVNSDTTSGHYRYGFLYGGNGGASGAGSSSSAFMRLGTVPGGGATASYYDSGEILIPFYANTTGFKSLIAKGGWIGGPDQTSTSEGQWLSTSAITSITLTPAAGNFVGPGTQVVLYGLT